MRSCSGARGRTRCGSSSGSCPSDEPFAPGPERVLSRSVTRFSLAYRDEAGAWQERWDGREAGGLPTAVRLELAVAGLARTTPALVVALPMGKRAQ